jgi:hypothetical protein
MKPDVYLIGLSFSAGADGDAALDAAICSGDPRKLSRTSAPLNWHSVATTTFL